RGDSSEDGVAIFARCGVLGIGLPRPPHRDARGRTGRDQGPARPGRPPAGAGPHASGACRTAGGATARAWLLNRSGRRSSLRSSCALRATTTVDADINNAPTDIGITKPTGASTPAASGTEMRL